MERSILYVEHDETDRLAFETFFGCKAEFHCIIVETLAQATQTLQTEPIDVIVVDSHLINEEGLLFLKTYSEMPVVIVAAHNDIEQAIRSLRSIGCEFLIKDEQRSYLRVLPLSFEQSIYKKNEERDLSIFTQIVEQNPSFIVVTDNQGTIEYANPKAAEITGYTKEEMIGKNPRVLKSGQHDTNFYKNLWDTITAGKVWSGEFCNKRCDGHLYWEIASIAPIKNKAGVITHFIKVAEVITEKKKAEQERLDSERSNAVMQMAGAISHEINQPLQIILGYTELLKERLKDDASASKQFQNIIKNIDRIMDISKKLKGITDYRTREYLDGIIVDIHQTDEI